MTTCTFSSELAPALIPQLLLNLSCRSRQSFGLIHRGGFPRLIPSRHSPFPWSRHPHSPVVWFPDCLGGKFEHVSFIMFPTQEEVQGTRAPHITFTTQEARRTRAPHIVSTSPEARRNRSPYQTETHFQLPSWFQQRRLPLDSHSYLPDFSVLLSSSSNSSSRSSSFLFVCTTINVQERQQCPEQLASPCPRCS